MQNVRLRKFYMFIPIELAIRPSRVYAAVLLVACGLAATGIWLAVVPLWVKAAMSLTLVLALFHYLGDGSTDIRGLRITQSGQIQILHADWQAAGIKGQPVVLPWLISLVIEPEGARARRLTIWPDAVDPASARKLRVWLKWGFQPEQG